MTSSLEAHKLLQELRSQPITDVNFPSHFNVAIKLREALQNGSVTLGNVVSILGKDPLIAASAIQSANMANQGKATRDLQTAVSRLGFEKIKTIVMEVTAQQLAASSYPLAFQEIARLVWLNSVYCASAAFVLAEETEGVSPNDAFFTALVINLGAFYLINKASEFAVLRASKDDVLVEIRDDYLNKTLSILDYIGLPDNLLRDIDHLRESVENCNGKPETITEVIRLAHELSRLKYSWLPVNEDITSLPEVQALIPLVDEQFMKTKRTLNI